MNCMIVDDSLCLPIGTKIRITQKRITKTRVNLKNGAQHNEFYAIFDQNDVDFQIGFDNRECDRGFVAALIVNEEYHSFYVEPNTYWRIKTLVTNGRKLHLMSEYTERGTDVISQTATKYGTSRELASINCSRIWFEIEFEEYLNKAINPKFANIGDNLIGTEMQVFVKTLAHNMLTINIGANNTVNDLKTIITKRVGIPSADQTIIFCGKLLADDQQLAVCGVTNESNIELRMKLNGGLKSIANESDDSLLSYDESDFDDSYYMDSDSDSDDSSTHPNANLTYNMTESQLFSGERGVICYGEQSDQQFVDYHDFKADSNLPVNSFVIEMRMKLRH